MSDELNKLTVQALRELARKRLGRGFSRLKTKAALVAALREASALQDSPASSAEGSASRPAAPKPVVTAMPSPPTRPPATITRFPRRTPAESSEQFVAQRAAGGAVTPAVRASPARMASSGPPVSAGYGANGAASRVGANGSGGGQASPGRGRGPPPPVATAPSPTAQPVVEGFFVVKVAGPAEAERRHLTESSGAPRGSPPVPSGGHQYDEQLGELPDIYEDDAELLLPRDPHTLFFLWDYARDTRQGALAGLVNPRARLKIFDGDEVVRELEFALESRSYYVHGLTPGRSYRVEAYFLGDGGRMRRLGKGSNVIALPSVGPSSDLTVRFMRIPWNVSLARVRELLQQARDGSSWVSAPRHLPLPSSQTSRELSPQDRAAVPLPPRLSLPSSAVGSSESRTWSSGQP